MSTQTQMRLSDSIKAIYRYAGYAAAFGKLEECREGQKEEKMFTGGL